MPRAELRAAHYRQEEAALAALVKNMVFGKGTVIQIVNA